MAVQSRVTARDLMRTELIVLRTDSSVEEAVQTFEEYRITGAPVVDAAGTPVGFLSLRDIASSDHIEQGRIETERREHILSEAYDESMGDEDFLDDAIYNREDYSPEVLGRRTVDEWMKAEVVSVDPEASLTEVCQAMVSEQIHRLLVIEKGSMVGIVTTFDIVRHLASE